MKTFLIFLSLALFSMTAAPAVASHGEPTARPASDEIVLKVNGLVCDFCAQAIQKVFSRQDGVETVSVDLDHMEVRVQMQQSQDLPDELLAKLVTDSGYSLVEIVRHDHS